MLEGGVVIAEEGRAKDVDGNYYTWTDEVDGEEVIEYTQEEIEAAVEAAGEAVMEKVTERNW
jgi:hypothetical protein